VMMASTRLATTHKAQTIMGRMSTKQLNGRGLSVLRANRSGSSSAQRRPANSANAKRSYEKYVTLARAAALSGDVVETENYYKHTEHYFRLMKDERTRSGQEEVDGTPGVEANEQQS
jgi:Domain of unknown function (DUF4167)